MGQSSGFDDLDDQALEEHLRECAFRIDADLLVARTGDEERPWVAAFQVYRVPTALAPQGVSRLRAEAVTRREALLALAREDDLRRTRDA